jgi:hypothetical protein
MISGNLPINYNNECDDPTLEDLVLRFDQDRKCASTAEAVAFSVSGAFYKIGPKIKQRLLEFAPPNARKIDGSLCCSDEMQLIFIRDENGSLVLNARVGIWALFELKYSYPVDYGYMSAFTDIATDDLFGEGDWFDKIGKALSGGPVVSGKQVVASEVDKCQSAYEWSLNTVVHDIVAPDAVALFDPAPGSVSRMTSVKNVEVTDSPLVNKDEVVVRSEKVGSKVNPYRASSTTCYYVGFYDHRHLPRNFVGFEVNPYSRFFKCSGRVVGLSMGTDRNGRVGHDFIYTRKGVKIKHFFPMFPTTYYRYKTKLTVPFFQGHNKGFASSIRDDYVFISSDPFLTCFNNVSALTSRTELFPIGLRPCYEHDSVEEVELDYTHKKRVKVKFCKYGADYVDIVSDLAYDSRRTLFLELLAMASKPLPDFSKLLVNRLEHPISGDLYEKKKKQCELFEFNGYVVLLDEKDNPTHDFSRVVAYSSFDKRYSVTKDDAFLGNANGTYKLFKLKINSFGDLVTVQGMVPGAPTGFVVSPQGKRNYFSVVRGNRDAVQINSELEDYYKNTVWYKSYKYVYEDVYFDKNKMNFDLEPMTNGVMVDVDELV